MQLLFPKSTTQTLSELKHQLNWNNVILTCTLIIYISTTLSEEEREFFFLNSCVPLDILTVLGEEKQNRKKKSCAHVCGSYQATCEEPVTDNVSCLYEVEVQPNEAPLSPPTASPAVTMGR